MAAPSTTTGGFIRRAGPQLVCSIASVKSAVPSWAKASLRSAMGAGVITEHRVTHPEITVTGDEATGIWYLQDRVIVAEFDFMLIGAAFYHDRYRRTADGWRISATGYDRTYVATMSLKNLDFKITPGIALA